MEDTLVIVKPDGINKKLLIKIINRFIEEGLMVSNLMDTELNQNLIRNHYHHLVTYPFYKGLEEFMMSGVVVIMIVSGDNAVDRVRKIVGATDSKKALPNTIRGLYGNKENMAQNIIHASDSYENALIEIRRFYQEENDLINKNNKVYQKRRVYEKL